jgi:glycosyltransferase involved in cell wall biosynthesis
MTVSEPRRLLVLSWLPYQGIQNEAGEDANAMSWVATLASGLAHTGRWAVSVLSFNRNVSTLEVRSLADRDVWYAPLRSPVRRYSDGFASERRILRDAVCSIRPDLIHSQGLEFPLSYALRGDVPVVATIHGIPHDFLVGALKGGSPKAVIRGSINAAVAEVTVRRLRFATVVGPHGERFLRRRNGTARSALIPNPVSDLFYRARQLSDECGALFVGNDVERKGLSLLLRALSDSCERKLTVVSADNTGWLRRNLKRLRDRNIAVLAPLPNNSIADLMSRSKYLVLPSYAETAPMVIAEAQALGLPVVASDVGDVRWMLGEGKAGILHRPGDWQDLRLALRRLDQDPRLGLSLAHRGRGISERHRVNNVVAQTDRFFEEVLGQQ